VLCRIEGTVATVPGSSKLVLISKITPVGFETKALTAPEVPADEQTPGSVIGGVRDCSFQLILAGHLGREWLRRRHILPNFAAGVIHFAVGLRLLRPPKSDIVWTI
jgi:hypothetical protein